MSEKRSKKESKPNFEAISYIINFIESPKTFLNLCLSLKGLLEYVRFTNPLCVKNVKFEMKKIPKEKQTHVSNVHVCESENINVEEKLKNCEIYFPNLKRISMKYELLKATTKKGILFGAPNIDSLRSVCVLVNSKRKKDSDYNKEHFKDKKCDVPIVVDLKRMSKLVDFVFEILRMNYKKKYRFEDILYPLASVCFPSCLDNLKNLTLNYVAVPFDKSVVFPSLEKMHFGRCEWNEKCIKKEKYPMVKDISLLNVSNSNKIMTFEGLPTLEKFKSMWCDHKLVFDLSGEKLKSFEVVNYELQSLIESLTGFGMGDWDLTGKVNVKIKDLSSLVKVGLVVEDESNFLSNNLVSLEVLNVYGEELNLAKWKNLKHLFLINCSFEKIKGFQMLESVRILGVECDIYIEDLPKLWVLDVLDHDERMRGDPENLVVKNCPELFMMTVKRFGTKVVLSDVPKLLALELKSTYTKVTFETGAPELINLRINDHYFDIKKPEDMKKLKLIVIRAGTFPEKVSKCSRCDFHLLPALESVYIFDNRSWEDVGVFNFSHCSSIKKIFLSKNVTFNLYDLPKLENLTIPARIKHVMNFNALKKLELAISHGRNEVESIQKLKNLMELTIELDFCKMDDKDFPVFLKSLQTKELYLSDLPKLEKISIFKRHEYYFNPEKIKGIEKKFKKGILENDIKVTYFIRKQCDQFYFKGKFTDTIEFEKVLTKEVPVVIRYTGKTLCDLCRDCMGEVVLFMSSSTDFFSLFLSCKEVHNFLLNSTYFCKNIVFNLLRTSYIPKGDSFTYVLNVAVKKIDIKPLELGVFLKKFSNLENLDLTSCQKLNGSMIEKHSSKLKILNLSKSGKIESIHLMKLEELEELIIDHVSAIVAYNKTKKITIECCEKWKKLKKLRLSYCSTEKGFEALKKLPSLIDLDIWSQDFYMKEEDYSFFSRLKRLKLWHFELKDDFFHHLTKCEDLSIVGNELMSDFSFVKLQKLKKLTLHGTPLLTEKIFKFLPNLEYFKSTGDENILFFTDSSKKFLESVRKVFVCCDENSFHKGEVHKSNCSDCKGIHLFCPSCKNCGNCLEQLCKKSFSTCEKCKNRIHTSKCGFSCEKCGSTFCKKCNTSHFGMPWCNCEIEVVCNECKHSFMKCSLCRRTRVCEGCSKIKKGKRYCWDCTSGDDDMYGDF